MDIPNRDEWLIIAISGVTCGGKTTLANQLLRTLTPVYVFHQDKYFYPDDSPNHIRCEGIDHNNYDVLSALDMKQMYLDVLSTIAGVDKSHCRALERPGRLELPGKKFLIVEGFTVLNYEPLVQLADLRWYFVLPYGECFARRVLRAYEPPDVPGYFERCVWPAHALYRAQVESDPRVRLLDGMKHDALAAVTAALAARGAARAR